MHPASNILAEAIDQTPWIDTHEHLVEERHRLGDQAYEFVDSLGPPVTVPLDWTSLIAHYAIDDLVSCGLPPRVATEVVASSADPIAKWDLLAPYVARTRNTGYWRAVDSTTERLFGLRLDRASCEEVDRRLRDLRSPGYYRQVLQEIANVERCQVHTLDEDPFCESHTPRLLEQDLSLVPLIFGKHERAERLSGIEVSDLAAYLDVLEWCFERYAPRAVAAKCLAAYSRPLRFQSVESPPEKEFARVRVGEASPSERRRVEDFLLGRCLDLATSHGLPIKFHLGYLAGNHQEQLRGLREHVQDMSELVLRRPRLTFVLMHMAWPHQEEVLALAKHQPNVVVDLCWSWILTPLATAEFVARFLTTAPASKLLCFGGDLMTVENVVGHAELARRGLQAALEGLVAHRHLTAEQALDLVEPLMRGNADRVLPAATELSA